MSRTVSIKLGLNGAFATRRWERPETIVRLTREVGYDSLEFCADQIDVFFMGNADFRQEMAARVRAAAETEGVEVWDLYTGVATHRFHGFSHSDPRVRERMMEWMREAMQVAVALGGPRLGGHVDAIPVESLNDAEAYGRARARAYAYWRQLAREAADLRLEALYLEQMYVPSEIPWTLEQAEEAMVTINAESEGVPVYLTVDVGHQAGQQYGLQPPDTDYLEWVRRFGAFSQVIHLQQTTPEGSQHWPFTPRYNERGKVNMAEFMAALREAHEAAGESALAECLDPVGEQRLVLEAIPGSTKCEELLLEELRISAKYLYEFVPREGLSWTV